MPGDDVSDPILITGLPYYGWHRNRGATLSNSDPDCEDRASTVWLSYTATTTESLGVTATVGNAHELPALVVAVRRQDGRLTALGCNAGGTDGERSAIRFSAESGTTYLFMVGASDFGRGATFDFSLDVSPMPSLAIDVTSAMFEENTILVRGSIRCSPLLANTHLNVRVRQEVDAVEADGRGFLYSQACTPEGIEWAIPVTATTGTFAYVHTYVTARLSHDDAFGEYGTEDEAEIPFENDPTPSPR